MRKLCAKFVDVGSSISELNRTMEGCRAVDPVTVCAAMSSALLRNVENLTRLNLVRIVQLVSIRLKDLLILVGVSVELLADLR